ncbi:hypothetical protein SCOCK_150007 [Actinacidiphila cocklensis]|uniref:Uncharacterized protein n=1 Tax=Actinacidiphila cocklensis TaxID=887465 RepID=A0A9W4DL84_9ACTN|nr:hypothetical protein SCOCK_150007 [Actinacidiphila cocklensis]
MDLPCSLRAITSMMSLIVLTLVPWEGLESGYAVGWFPLITAM